jgi:hypothetical protein
MVPHSGKPRRKSLERNCGLYVWLAEECTEMRMDTSARDVSPHNTPDSDADGVVWPKKPFGSVKADD